MDFSEISKIISSKTVRYVKKNRNNFLTLWSRLGHSRDDYGNGNRLHCVRHENLERVQQKIDQNGSLRRNIRPKPHQARFFLKKNTQASTGTVTSTP